MKKHSKLDAFFDVVILAVLIFTIMVTVTNPIVKYILVVAACGAMFNNVKHVMKRPKKKSKKKKEINK